MDAGDPSTGSDASTAPQPRANKYYPRTGKRGAPQAFPRKLFEILSEQPAEIISWNPSGLTFMIHDMPRFVSEVERRAPGSVYVVVFTMGPSSPCGPCHELRPVVRASAEALRGKGVRFGSVACDVAHLQGLCAQELEGRQYYPLIKVFGSDRSRSASIIELRQSELPAAAVLHVCTELLVLLDSPAAAPEDESAVAKRPPWGVYSSTPLGPA